MNAKRRLLMLFALGVSFLSQVAAAPAGRRYCERYPKDPRCQTLTVTPQIRETEEFPPIESTPTDTSSATPIPSETPETPAPTDEIQATPTTSATPDEDPVTTPTSTPEVNSSCEVHEEYVSWDWTAWYATYQGGYNETVVWSFSVSGTDWVGMWQGVSGDTRDGWGPGNINPGAFGTLLPAGNFTVNVTVDGMPGVVCSSSITVPSEPAPSPIPEQEPAPEEETQSSPEPSLSQSIGTTSPDGWYEGVIRDGEFWVIYGNGQEFNSGVDAKDCQWLADWSVLCTRQDNSLVLTDRLATFERELGVSGELLTVSVDGEWVKVSNDGHPTVVSIHGAGYGLGSADAQAFANIVFPDHASGP